MHREALHDGSIVLIDTCLDDLGRIAEDESEMPDSTLVGYLPSRYLPRYTQGFLHRFFVCMVTVAWKLAQPTYIPLACVAEELAAHAIIQQAQVSLDMHGHDPDMGVVYDLFFEDLDFEYLFDDAYDGIDETELARTMGMTSLTFDEWFVPFRGNEDPHFGAVHPFVQEESNADVQAVEPPDTDDEPEEKDSR